MVTGPSRAIGLVLFLGTLAVFWPLREAEFVSYDDPGYVYANPAVAGGVTTDGLVWAFGTFHKANYHPLTWVSHMVDVELFGMEAGGHHLVNVTLHALNTALLFLFLLRATGARWPSAFVAALFAVHPLHVESVAWISERKDVLATFFWMLGLHGYLSWVRFGGGLRYAAVLVVLAAGLLSKPVVVTLPCVFLLMDVWPLRRIAPTDGPEDRGAVVSIGRLVWEKLPMFAVVAAASFLTLQAQTAGGAVVSTPDLSAGARIANAVIAYAWYLRKMLWPAGLAVLYPHPYLRSGLAPGGTAWLGPLLLLLGLSAAAVMQGRRRPWVLVGWLWFLGTLVPMIGLVQVGAQATADRYSYVSLIGPFVVIAWLGAEMAAGAPWRRRVVGSLALLVLVACVGVTRAQLAHWRDARALAERSVAVTSDNYVMHYNLALVLQEEGDLAGARQHYERAIEIDPSQAGFHDNLATVLVALGEPDEAVRHYRAAIRLGSKGTGAANNLAWLRATHPDPSVRDGAEAVRLAELALGSTDAPEAQILDTLAAAQAEVGDFQAAVATSERGARLARSRGNPALADAIAARGRAYAAGRPHRETPGAAR